MQNKFSVMARRARTAAGERIVLSLMTVLTVLGVAASDTLRGRTR